MNEIQNIEATYKNIRTSVVVAYNRIYSAVNTAMVGAYWEIGEQIYKASGENERAEYGTNSLTYVSKRLTAEFGKGFTVRNLQNMRKFYVAFPIRQTLSSELSWSHYCLLMNVQNEKARDYYVTECAKAHWSVRQLKRQITTFYYERILSSQNIQSLTDEIEKLEPRPDYPTIIKDPMVLEFLGLEANPHFYEKDLEQAIIDRLQKFLLELGRGYSFVSRQQKITFDGRNFFIDLVFYNYMLKCFVLVDLKLGDLTHQDLGQMQMYVNFYTRELMNEGDNPPIGIVLCADKSESLVRYTLPENNNQIFASKYKLYLPTEEELKREIDLKAYEKMSTNNYK